MTTMKHKENKESELKLYLLRKPRKLMGTIVEERVLYFPCSECNSKEPEIAGWLGYGPLYENILIVDKGDRRYFGFLCSECITKYKGHTEETAEEGPA